MEVERHLTDKELDDMIDELYVSKRLMTHTSCRYGADLFKVTNLTNRHSDKRLQSFCSLLSDSRSTKVIPVDIHGRVMTREEFARAAADAHAFYDNGPSDEQIEQHNEDLRSIAILKSGRPKAEYAIAGTVYVITTDYRMFKIGRTEDLDSRISQLAGANAYEIDVVNRFSTADTACLETLLHQRYAKFRVRGEWFGLPPEVIEELNALERFFEKRIR